MFPLLDRLPKKIQPHALKFGLNFWPCIGRTGGRVVYVSDDFMQLRVRLKLNWKTRNLVGTIFGGSLYASTDPFFMILLYKLLGQDYVVWDKGCTLRFRKPASRTIHADFIITPEMLQEVKDSVARDGETTFTWKIAYRDEQGTVYAEFDKVLYAASKDFYKAKLEKRTPIQA